MTTKQQIEKAEQALKGFITHVPALKKLLDTRIVLPSGTIEEAISMNRQIFAILEGLHDKVGEFHYMQPTGKLVRNKEDQISEKIQILKKLLNAKKKDEEVEVPKDLEYIDTPSESNHLAAFLVKMKEVVAEINKVFDLVKEVMSSETTANGVIEESFQDLCKLHRTLVIINKCFYYEHRDSYEKSGLQKKLAAKYEKLKNEIAVLESYL